MAQVGYPLANGREDRLDCFSSDRFSTLSVGAVAPGEDKEVGELVFWVGNGIEGRGAAVFLAELTPESEDLVTSLAGLASDGRAGDFERSAEISLEECLLSKWSSRHGASCG